MDSVFQLSHGDRVNYLYNLMHSVAASYICLWTYSPDLNFLHCEQGCFQLQEGSSSSSTGESTAQGLFNQYKLTVFPVGNDIVPGLAFRDGNPYLELQESELQRLASVEPQRQFYREANIKTAIFLGCQKGEIELGMSQIQHNLEMKMQTLCPITEFEGAREQQSKATSASSSPQSIGSSPEYPTNLYNILSTSNIHLQGSALYIQSTIPMTTSSTNTTQMLTTPHFHPLLPNIPFPTPESTDAALTKAYLAILSSPSSSSRGGDQSCFPYQVKQKESAFRSYHSSSLSHLRFDLRRQTLFKRAIAFYKGLNIRRIQDLAMQGSNRPTYNQLHHMLSERRRREKINESFQALRSLLPHGTKKDKASVLRTTKEQLSSLRAQLSEVSKRNQILEAELLSRKRSSEPSTNNNVDFATTTDKRLIVRVTPVSESTSSSAEKMVDLQIILRPTSSSSETTPSSSSSVPDLVIRVLEFLKQVKEASMVSMDAQTHQQTPGAHLQILIPTNFVSIRLRIEGSEWDEAAFIEALRRLLSDLAT